MKIATLEDLLVEELRDLYSAETQLVKALPKMAKAAGSDELRTAIENHLQETQGQVQRLEQIFEHLSARPKGKKCAAMEGLIEEGKELMQEDIEDESVMDAGLIAAAQKVEHYEIASYGTVRTWAQQLGLNEVAQLLEQTLEEEKQADKKLNQIATEMVNEEAADSDESDEEESAPTKARGNGARAGGASRGKR